MTEILGIQIPLKTEADYLRLKEAFHGLRREESGHTYEDIVDALCDYEEAMGWAV